MQEGDPSLDGMERALLNLRRRNQFRLCGPARPIRKRAVQGRPKGELAVVPADGGFLSQGGLFVEIREGP